MVTKSLPLSLLVYTVCLSINLTVSLSLSVCISIYAYTVCLFIFLSIILSVSFSVPLCVFSMYNVLISGYSFYLQLFQVAYVLIKMGNSPRPGIWVLERSVDNGLTYTPWQYFADSPG